MAITADGKIASADRRLTHFGSARDGRHLYELRSTADAILCGARTVEQSHSTLGNGGERYTRIRLRSGRREYPVRVVLSGSGSISPAAAVWSRPYGPIVVATTSRASRARLRWLHARASVVYRADGKELDWRAFLSWLWAEYGVERVLSEGGGELNDALFRAGVVDELNLTWCPLLLGGRNAPTVADGVGFPSLAAAARLKLVRCRREGDEFFFTYRFLG